MKRVYQTLSIVIFLTLAACAIPTRVQAAKFHLTSASQDLEIPTSLATDDALAAPLARQAKSSAIGLNFTAATSQESSYYPADPAGGVGPNHIVQLLNGYYSVYDKTTGSQLQAATNSDFWSQAGIPDVHYTTDPRLLYDAASQRWFAVVVDNINTTNRFLVAVSRTSDPTTGWTGWAIHSDTTGQRWADFPTVGINRDGLYITATLFPIPGRGATNLTKTVVVLPKADLIADTPTIANATRFENVALADLGFVVQPAVDLDNTSLPLPLLSDYNTAAGVFKRSTISGPATRPTLDTTPPFVPMPPYAAPIGAEQPGPQQNLEIYAGSAFQSNIIQQNGTLWGVQTVQSAGRNALRWFQLDALTNALLQQGLIADPNLDFYYGSIAVNDFNDVMIGFNGSGENQFASSYAVLGHTANGATRFDDPLLLKAGAASYQVVLDGRNRWGNYSTTVVDPTNPRSFWTFQEFARSETEWGTQITQINFDSKDAHAAAVPEPSSLIGAATAGLLGAAWRQRQKKRS